VNPPEKVGTLLVRRVPVQSRPAFVEEAGARIRKLAVRNRRKRGSAGPGTIIRKATVA